VRTARWLRVRGLPRLLTPHAAAHCLSALPLPLQPAAACCSLLQPGRLQPHLRATDAAVRPAQRREARWLPWRALTPAVVLCAAVRVCACACTCARASWTVNFYDAFITSVYPMLDLPFLYALYWGWYKGKQWDWDAHREFGLSSYALQTIFGAKPHAASPRRRHRPAREGGGRRVRTAQLPSPVARIALRARVPTAIVYFMTCDKGIVFSSTVPVSWRIFFNFLVIGPWAVMYYVPFLIKCSKLGSKVSGRGRAAPPPHRARRCVRATVLRTARADASCHTRSRGADAGRHARARGLVDRGRQEGDGMSSSPPEVRGVCVQRPRWRCKLLQRQ